MNWSGLGPALKAYAEALHQSKQAAPTETDCVTCNRCGWVYFAVTRDYAEKKVAAFNEFYSKANPETQALYGNHESSIVNYEHCFRCGNPYTDFRPAKADDCPVGCTLNPIIRE